MGQKLIVEIKAITLTTAIPGVIAIYRQLSDHCPVFAAIVLDEGAAHCGNQRSLRCFV
jgi:hypothetical protein